MEETKKRPKEESLQESNETEESKPSNSFSASGAEGTDEDHVRETDRETTSNGEEETKLESSLKDGNVSSTEGSTFVDDATLEDQSTEFKNDDHPEVSEAKTDELPKRRGRGRPRKAERKMYVKKGKVGHGESELIKEDLYQQLKYNTCVCGRSYTCVGNLRRHQKIHGCLSGSAQAEEPFFRLQTKADCKTTSNGEEETKLASSLKDGNLSSTEGSTFVDGATLEDQSTEFKNDDHPEVSEAKTDVLPKRRGRGRPRKAEREMYVKKEKVGHGESEMIKDAPYQQPKYNTCVCGRSYTCGGSLRRHQIIHGCLAGSAQPEKPFSCLCGKSFSVKSQLNRHKKTCQPGSKSRANLYRPYVCACGRAYTSLSCLTRHQRTDHVEEKKEKPKDIKILKRYLCDCGKTFANKSRMLQHEKKHGQKKVQTKKRKRDPVEVNAERVKPYVCYCGRTYTCTSHLYRHQKINHNENLRPKYKSPETKMEKHYKCDCGKSYTSFSHLYRHQTTHETVELIVDDPDCDSEVLQEEFEDKPFQCECGKTFILWFSLMVHKRIHCKANPPTSSEQDSP